jgi:hypothetical protein
VDREQIRDDSQKGKDTREEINRVSSVMLPPGRKATYFCADLRTIRDVDVVDA